MPILIYDLKRGGGGGGGEGESRGSRGGGGKTAKLGLQRLRLQMKYLVFRVIISPDWHIP